MLELVIAKRNDPHLGLRFVEALGFGTIETLGFLALACRTIGEATERVLRYRAHPCEPVELELAYEGDLVRLRAHSRVPPSLAQAQLVEMHVAAGLSLVPRLARRPVEVRSLLLRHRPLGSLATYERMLGTLPRFCADRDEWAWPRSVMDLPVPTANDSLSGLLETYLETSRRAAHDFRTQTREAIASVAPDKVTLDSVARVMGMGSRTLQRRLREIGCTFAVLFAEVREATAKLHLAAGLAPSEISHVLGFTEPAAFHRAFKRWTGMAPEAWRQRQRAMSTHTPHSSA